MCALRLGPVTLKNPWILAPMEAVSDYGFRSLCTRLGAALTFTEMVRASSFLRQTPGTMALIDTKEPAGVQFLTKDPVELRKLIALFFSLRASGLEHFKNVRVIDLNFGCPNPELIHRGMGPAMLKRTQKMELLFKTLSTVHDFDADIAVGAKVRLGLNQREVEQRVLYRLLPAANAHLDYLTVHGRHAGMRSTEPADWTALRAVKEELDIPFIANGGALDAVMARDLRLKTKADAVMIARGAIADPWIFQDLTGGKRPSEQEIASALQAYLSTNPIRKYRDFHTENFQRLMTLKISS